MQGLVDDSNGTAKLCGHEFTKIRLRFVSGDYLARIKREEGSIILIFFRKGGDRRGLELTDRDRHDQFLIFFE
jgi:hypothetical protein